MTSPRQRLEDTFFEELRDWSQIKLRILSKYVTAYLRYRRKTNPILYYIDAFAGRGRYGEGDDAEAGSPVLIAQHAANLLNSGRPGQLRCINVELNERNFDELRQSLREYPPELVDCLYGSFSEHLPLILRRIDKAPAIFFLDPFGVRPIALADLRALLARSDTELLLNFNARRLRMLAGFEDSNSKESAAKLRLVGSVLGEGADTSNWLRSWHRMKPVEWENWAARTYAMRLVSSSPYLKYGLTYPVRETFRANPKYFLVFATRSSEAVEVMNDLVCIEEDNLFESTER